MRCSYQQNGLTFQELLVPHAGCLDPSVWPKPSTRKEFRQDSMMIKQTTKFEGLENHLAFFQRVCQFVDHVVIVRGNKYWFIFALLQNLSQLSDNNFFRGHAHSWGSYPVLIIVANTLWRWKQVFCLWNMCTRSHLKKYLSIYLVFCLEESIKTFKMTSKILLIYMLVGTTHNLLCNRCVRNFAYFYYSISAPS